MTNKVDFDTYTKFVDAVTSDESKDFIALSDRLVSLDEKGANIERLLTGAVGICAEGGEIMEIVKKVIFQSKSWNEDTKTHIQKELSDVLWYFAQICIALNISFDEVMQTNIDKLSKRYPNGYFEMFYSENRAVDDL